MQLSEGWENSTDYIVTSYYSIFEPTKKQLGLQSFLAIGTRIASSRCLDNRPTERHAIHDTNVAIQ
jgi:hypothetical protein